MQSDRSAASFAKLRDAYLKVFPDLPEEHRKRLSAATSTDQLADLFYWILDHGKRIRLRVKTVFRGEDLEDDDDDDDDAGKTVEVWTAFGDCGFPFQTGETYLVYADSDEESDVMTTGACTRLSDAGGISPTSLLLNWPPATSRLQDHRPSAKQYMAHHRTSSPRRARSELRVRDAICGADDKGHFVSMDSAGTAPLALHPDYPSETQPLTA